MVIFVCLVNTFSCDLCSTNSVQLSQIWGSEKSVQGGYCLEEKKWSEPFSQLLPGRWSPRHAPLWQEQRRSGARRRGWSPHRPDQIQNEENWMQCQRMLTRSPSIGNKELFLAFNFFLLSPPLGSFSLFTCFSPPSSPCMLASYRRLGLAHLKLPNYAETDKNSHKALLWHSLKFFQIIFGREGPKVLQYDNIWYNLLKPK